jgi:hypothetical protein
MPSSTAVKTLYSRLPCYLLVLFIDIPNVILPVPLPLIPLLVPLAGPITFVECWSVSAGMLS